MALTLTLNEPKSAGTGQGVTATLSPGTPFKVNGACSGYSNQTVLNAWVLVDGTTYPLAVDAAAGPLPNWGFQLDAATAKLLLGKTGPLVVYASDPVAQGDCSLTLLVSFRSSYPPGPAPAKALLLEQLKVLAELVSRL
jgi:hypothetical protein